MFSDPLGDMLTRIRNAHSRLKRSLVSPYSKLREKVLEVLKDEGYIYDYKKRDLGQGKAELEVELKYYNNLPVIKEIKRISKPGRRIYVGVKEIPVILGGLGVCVLSTPKGVIPDYKARNSNTGGEVLFKVF